MVAIRHWEADKFVRSPPEHIEFYLFYGTDAGLVNERARGLIRSAVKDPEDAFQLVKIDGDELAGDLGRLADEVNTLGLFGGRRAIWVRAGSRNVVPGFEAAMRSTAPNAIVVVEAGALKKESGLRKLFERERRAAAVECAHDSPDQLRAIIESEAKSAGLSIDRSTAELLSHSLGADRLTTRSELNKLLLYKHGADEITESDVQAVVADAAALNLDTATNAAFSGRLDLVDETVQLALVSGNDPGMLIGMASRHAVMLHRARLDSDRGVPRDAAIEKAARRAFVFMRKEALATHFERWTSNSLARAIEILGRAAEDCRKEARLADVVAIRAFWSIASAARRGVR